MNSPNTAPVVNRGWVVGRLVSARGARGRRVANGPKAR